MAKIKYRTLPNPDAYREPCVDECNGCEKMFVSDIGDVCECYASPTAIWKRHGGCSFNIKEEETKSKKKINPLKMSKRKNR